MKITILILFIGLVSSQDMIDMDTMDDLSSVILPEINLNEETDSGFATDQMEITEPPMIIPSPRSFMARNHGARAQIRFQQLLPLISQQVLPRAGASGTPGGAAPSYGAPAPLPAQRISPVSHYGAKSNPIPKAAPRASPAYGATPAVLPTASPRTSSAYRTNAPASPTAAPRTSPTYKPPAQPTARPTAAPRTSPAYGAVPSVMPTAAPRTSAAYNVQKPAVRAMPLPVVRASDNY